MNVIFIVYIVSKIFYILSTFLIGNVCNKLLQLNSISLRLIDKRALQNYSCGEVNYIWKWHSEFFFLHKITYFRLLGPKKMDLNMFPSEPSMNIM